MKSQIPFKPQSQASSTRRISRRGVKRAKAAPGKRTKSVCLRLSEAEHETLRGKARAAGMSASELLRDHLGRSQIYNHRQTQVWLATLLSVRKVLLALAERAAAFRPVDAVVITAYLASIARQLEQFAWQETEYAHKILPSRNGHQ